MHKKTGGCELYARQLEFWCWTERVAFAEFGGVGSFGSVNENNIFISLIILLRKPILKEVRGCDMFGHPW